MRPESWARFCGFLVSRKARLYAHIREPEFQEFQGKYVDETGELLPPYCEGCGYCVEPEDMNKWATSLSIHVTATSGEMMAASAYSALPVEVEIKRRGTQSVIYNSDVAWKLIAYGFQLDSEPNVERIREEIVPTMRKEFDLGVALGKGP